MWPLLIEGAAATYIISLSTIMKCENLASQFLFKALPMLVGVGLAFVTTARVMGWPL
jgi:hypothetical protein